MLSILIETNTGFDEANIPIEFENPDEQIVQNISRILFQDRHFWVSKQDLQP